MTSAAGSGGAVSARSGVTTTGTSWAAGNAVGSLAKRFRQPKTWLVLTSYCRATTDTDAPGANEAETISRLSASGQDLCRRVALKLVSITAFVDTSNPTTLTKASSLRQFEKRR